MIRSAKIDGFKIFRQFELKDVPPILIVGGRNGTGKTSLLEALFAFFDRNNPVFPLRLLQWRGIPTVALSPEAFWGPSFSDYNLDKRISIELQDESNNWEKVEISVRQDPLPSVSRPFSTYPSQAPAQSPIPSVAPVTPTSTSSSSAVSIVSTSAAFTPQLTLELVASRNGVEEEHSFVSLDGNGPQMRSLRPLSPTRPVYFLSSWERLSSLEKAIRLGDLDKKRKIAPVISALQLIDERVIGLATLAERDGPRIYVDLKGTNAKIPINLMGDGMTRLLDMLLAISASPQGVVFIDEIENGVHYSVMSDVWRAISQAAKENSCQIVATTHSYESVRAAQRAFLNGQRNYFAYARLDRVGADIVATRYASDSLFTALEEGIEIR